ncbi:glycosyltransferase [Psychrobacter sp. DM4]|uniref:glycosyltransferase n=1 Tax=Psychrobacter sp. DM4 TaxID=3440637 RepID=UPI003F500642
MNILHIISAPASGGAEVYVKDLVKHLAKQHNVHVAFLSSAADAGRDIEYEARFLEDLQASGVQTYVIGNETRKKPWLGMIRLRRYVKDNHIEICHTHLAYSIIFSALLRVPVVYTHHSIEPRWGRITYRAFNKLIDEYVGISKKCASALESYTNRRVTTINNAVSKDKFDGYVRIRSYNGIVKIAMVGRLTAQKDYYTMLTALTLVDANTRQRIKVSIAGEGSDEYKRELSSFIRSNKLEDHVQLVGVISNIPKFLYDADIFLMTSAWEGLPIALTEATVSGLPCIVTNVGGCIEVIERSNNGRVVKPNDPQAIANAITKFVTDKSLIEKLSQNAIDSADYYAISRAADLHISLYESMLQ